MNIHTNNQGRSWTLPVTTSQNLEQKLEVDILTVYFFYFENVGQSGYLLQLGRSPVDRLLDGQTDHIVHRHSLQCPQIST